MTKRLSTSRPDLEKFWYSNNELEFKNATAGSRIEVSWLCPKGHKFPKSIKAVASRMNLNCPQCILENSVYYSNPELNELFNKARNNFDLKKLQSRNTSVWWVLSCGHSTKRTVMSIINSKTCYECDPKSLRKSKVSSSYPELIKLWSYKHNTSDFNKLSSWDTNKYWWLCENNHLELKTIYQKARTSSDCKLCQTKALSDCILDVSFDDVKNSFDKRSIYCKSRKKAWWLCRKGHSFNREIKDQVITNRMCPVCSNFGGSISTLELEVRKAFERIVSQDLIYNYRNIKGVFEVDIYVPSLKVAFEVNGEYWHSDPIARKNGWCSAKEKHESKVISCAEGGVNLFFIWEDDWRDNQLMVIEEILKVLSCKELLTSLLYRTVSNRDIQN